MGRKTGPALMVIAAIGLWISSQLTWVKAGIMDDKTGGSVIDLAGSFWSLETTAIALLLLAGSIAGVALVRVARRAVGVITACAGAVVSLRPLLLLTNGASQDRALNLLHSSSENAPSGTTTSIPQWAEVASVDVVTLGPVIALVAAACAVFGGILLAMRPGLDTARARKYEGRSSRAERIEEDLEESPNSGRIMWDALDEDIDPTDRKS